MSTPPTLVQSCTPDNTWSDRTHDPITTPTFDVVSGDLLICVGIGTTNTDVLVTPTWTGTGAWTLRQSIVISGYDWVGLWTCAVTETADSRSVSATRTGAWNTWGFRVFQYRDHGGLGNTSKTNVSSGAPSRTLTMSANSASVCAIGDYSAKTTSRTWRTIGSSPMIEDDYAAPAGFNVVHVAHHGDSSIAGLKTLGMTAPTAQKYGIVVAEVKGLSATAPLTPTAVTATPGNAQADVSFTLGSDGGASITSSTITSTPGGLNTTVSGTGTTGTITGLTNDVPYTFKVTSTNSVGTSAASTASNSVTPTAPIVLPSGWSGWSS